jgi:hypothetical protein
MTNDEATGVAVRFWQRSQHATKRFDLGREVSRHSSGLRPGIGHCLIEQRAVHAGFFRLAALPRIAGAEDSKQSVRLVWRLSRKARRETERNNETQIDERRLQGLQE